MKFRVIGSNRQTGARMTLEMEAESKAAAERKATQAGMSVNHVQDISDGYVGQPAEGSVPVKGGKGCMGRLVGALVFILIVLAVAYYASPKVRHLFGH